MKVHIICMNDLPKFAIIQDEKKARAKMKKLSNEHWKRNTDHMLKSDYEQIYSWHIDTVDGE